MRAKSNRTNTVAVVQYPHRLSTDEVAQLTRTLATSIRQALCRAGHFNGIVPVKLPNRRLLWPTEAVFALVDARNSEAAK